MYFYTGMINSYTKISRPFISPVLKQERQQSHVNSIIVLIVQVSFN